MRTLTTALVVCATTCMASSALAQRQGNRARPDREARSEVEQRMRLREGPRPQMRDGAAARVRHWDDRPIVSHFEPQMGMAGDRIVIRGENLPDDAIVRVGRIEVVPHRRAPTRIVFRVPPRARDGAVFLVSPTLARPLYVGQFEVGIRDWRSEQERIEKERRRAARRAWERRRPEWDQSPAGRRSALAERERRLRKSRARRRRARIAELRKRWDAAFLSAPLTRAEIALHARRMARLRRMLLLAESRLDDRKVIRAEMLMAREEHRHRHRMAELRRHFYSR